MTSLPNGADRPDRAPRDGDRARRYVRRAQMSRGGNAAHLLPQGGGRDALRPAPPAGTASGRLSDAGAVAQLVRAWHTISLGWGWLCGGENVTHNPWVVGSSPTRPT